MVCSFCKKDQHNVRSCKALKAATAVYTTKTFVSWTLDGFTDSVVAAGIADLCGTGGLSLVITTIYEVGKLIISGVNLAQFLALTKAKQAKVILGVVDGGDLDILFANAVSES